MKIFDAATSLLGCVAEVEATGEVHEAVCGLKSEGTSEQHIQKKKIM